MKFMQSQESVIDPGSLEAVRRALDLESLRAGRHILRDSRRFKVGEVTVRKLWVAEIRAPAGASACLAAVVTDDQTAVAFAVPEDAEGRTLAADRLQFSPEWCDPVAATLATLDLWTGDNGIPIGGFSYGLVVETASTNFVARFGNLRHPSRAALESALLGVAERFDRDGSTPAVTAFLGRWQAAVEAATTA